jgi:hypothetical protein
VGRTVRIFHLSDLHGRSEDGPQGERARREAPLRWRVIREEWDKNLAALREDGRPWTWWCFERAVAMAAAMRIPLPDDIQQWLAPSVDLSAMCRRD